MVETGKTGISLIGPFFVKKIFQDGRFPQVSYIGEFFEKNFARGTWLSCAGSCERSSPHPLSQEQGLAARKWSAQANNHMKGWMYNENNHEKGVGKLQLCDGACFHVLFGRASHPFLWVSSHKSPDMGAFLFGLAPPDTGRTVMQPPDTVRVTSPCKCRVMLRQRGWPLPAKWQDNTPR